MLKYPHHRCITTGKNKGSLDKNRVLTAISRDKQCCVDVVEINGVLTEYPLYCCSVGSMPLAGDE